MAEHKDEHKDDSHKSGGISFVSFLKTLGYIIFAFGVIAVSIYVIFFNPETAQNFINFLIGIEFILALYIFYLLYNLSLQMKTFEHHNHDLMHFYKTRYVPEKDKGVQLSAIQMRFAKSKEHILSKYKEEWKIGIIELDTLLKDLLKNKNYVGDTVGELLKSGESKGLKSINDAWEAHKIRNLIVHEGIKYDMSNETAMQALRKYTTVFMELGIEGM